MLYLALGYLAICKDIAPACNSEVSGKISGYRKRVLGIDKLYDVRKITDILVRVFSDKINGKAGDL